MKYVMLGLSELNEEAMEELKRKRRAALTREVSDQVVSVKKKITCTQCEGSGMIGVHEIDDVVVFVQCTKCGGEGAITLWEYQMNRED